MSNFQHIIKSIIYDSPPGELEQIFNDLVVITGDESKETILDILKQFNIENNSPILVDNENVVISKYNQYGLDNFQDPKSGKIFQVNHLTKVAENIENIDSNVSDSQLITYSDEIELELHKLGQYVKRHYPSNYSYAIYPIDKTNSNEFIIYIVSNKYNPNNFWNGDWNSKYIWNRNEKTLKGEVNVQVHYFEDGNVNFKSQKEINENVDNNDLLKTISDVEKNIESEIDQSFNKLNETQFKGLRRRLPVTRSKVNWGKAIGNYRLGKDAADFEKVK